MSIGGDDRRARFTGGTLALLVLLGVLAAGPVPADELADASSRGLELARAGDLEGAAASLEEALRLARERYGKSAPETATEVSNLAEVYRRLGRLDEAEPLAREAVEIDRRAGTTDTVEHAYSLNNLALIQVARGRYQDAEELHRRSIRILQEQAGPTSPDVATSMHNLALAFARKGQVERALSMERRALVIAERALGPSHPTTQAIRRTVATLAATESSPASGGGDPATEPRRPAAAVARTTAEPPGPAPRAPRPGEPDAVQQALAAAVSDRPPVPEPSAEPAPAARVEPAAGPRPVAGAIAEAPPADGSFYAFLVSVRREEDLASEWRRLSRRNPSLAERRPVRSPPFEVAGKGTYWRLMLGPFETRAQAQAACAPLRERKDPCEVVRR